jgi:lipopolysaccharide transport system permease protein
MRVNFAIIFGLFTTFLSSSAATSPAGYSLPGPVPVLVQILFAIGLGMMLGVLNVFFRDVGQFFTILLQFWFWFTPVVYPVADPASRGPRPAGLESDGGCVRPTRHPGERPAAGLGSLLPATVLALLLCALGLQLFRKRAGEMVDEL